MVSNDCMQKKIFFAFQHLIEDSKDSEKYVAELISDKIY